MTFLLNSDIILSAFFVVQYCCPVLTQYSNLLDLFGINTGQSGTVNGRIPIDDIASQSFALISFIQGLQKNPNKQFNKRLRKPVPQVALLDGIPVVPGIIGSFAGAGGCLPRPMPLTSQHSPSLFQNFLRFIPGAQDYLSDLVKTPVVDLHSLVGKYYWVISTTGVHDRYCPTTEYISVSSNSPLLFSRYNFVMKTTATVRNVAKVAKTSIFLTMDSFRVNNPHGAPKVGFGYGIIHDKKVYIYVQEDPCPYQIVITGPKNAETGQYEYIVITNWAKFPLVAMARDLKQFKTHYRNELIQRFKNEGYIHKFSKLNHGRIPIIYFRIIGNWMHEVDWTDCKPLTPIAFISNIIDRLIFGL
uniref:Lipocalin domain-containing protein n=1 Tax=Onchocerca volvulus TaxID=6282 RepID=A0A8R1TUL2_ONCVO